MTSFDGAVPSKDLARSWRLHLTALAGLIALILAEFHNAVFSAVEVWWFYPSYSHGFLIVPICLWLVWEQRDQIKQLQPVSDPRLLWTVPLLVLMWWIGELSTINEARQFAVVALLQLSIAVLLGPRILRIIWFPVFYLLFLVPTGEYLIGPMQQFATKFADISLNTIYIPHFTQGTVIELTNGRFEIAEACAGLRFLIATVAVGVLFAYLMFRKWYKIALFLVACIVAPLIGNGLRIVGIILLAHFTNNEYGAGADHLVYGWLFSVAILLGILFIGSWFRDEVHSTLTVSSAENASDTPQKILIVWVSAALLVSTGPALSWWHDNRVYAPDVSAFSRPLNVQHWREDKPGGDWQPAHPPVDASIATSLTPEGTQGASPVDVYVGFYARPRPGHTLAFHINLLWNDKSWAPVSSRKVIVTVQGQHIELMEHVISSPFERRMVWAVYWVDGHFTTSLLSVKVQQVLASLEGHEGQALVTMSTIVDGTDSDARRRLSNAISVLGDLSDRLNAANHRPLASN